MASGTGKSGWVEHLLVRAEVTVGLALEFIDVFHDFEALDQVGPHASEFNTEQHLVDSLSYHESRIWLRGLNFPKIFLSFFVSIKDVHLGCPI